MKTLLITFSLMLSMSTFAKTKKEFDENTEIQCYEELTQLGCVKNDQENTTCTQKNKAKLSKTCQELISVRN